MEAHRRARSGALALAVATGVGLVWVLVLGASAATGGIVTVCPSGPPACDYGTVQAGIDAAGAGDTVLISAGAYTEQVTLKSDVIIASSDGPEVTTITAIEGPVVTGTHVTSAAVQGVTISGRGILTSPVGVEVFDTSLTLVDCVVEDLYGADGDEASPDGKDAVAVRFTGAGDLIVTGSVIQYIGGGDSYGDADGDGGSATGIWVDGTARVTITAATVRHLSGGAAGYNSEDLMHCDGVGGHVLAIGTLGADLTVSDTQVTDLVGGWPCETGYGCDGYSGTALGVRATSGTVTLRNNTFTAFSVRPGYGSEANAIRTSQTCGTYLKGNVVDFSSTGGTTADMQPLSPFCGVPPRSEIGIASYGDAFLHMQDNVIVGLSGTGGGGEAVGVTVGGVADVRVIGNTLSHITGGSRYLAAVGISVKYASTVIIDANKLSEIHGGDAPYQYYYFFSGVEGGSAVGVDLLLLQEVLPPGHPVEPASGAATVTNNTIWSLSGGQGTNIVYMWFAGNDGGDAIALRIAEGKARVWNNVVYQTTAGLGGVGAPGTSDGQPGAAVGLGAKEDADVSAANNVLMDHDVGIRATSPSTLSLGYNALWRNGIDYSGVSPGAKDLHLDPGLVDAENGDFHLEASSPLVDAGTNWGAPGADFEGQPRPMDGDGDGVSVVDIGADEYWAGDLLAAKLVNQSIAAPGDVLTYQVTLVNPGAGSGFDVALTDTIPVGVTFVTGTLQGTAGAWGATNGVITWTATVSAAERMTLTFSVEADDAWVEPHAIVNQALLDDRTGTVRALQVTTLVNPRVFYFPLCFGVPW